MALTPDFDGDGQVTVADYHYFINAFAARDPRADFDGNGQFNVQDFGAFLNAVAGFVPTSVGWTTLTLPPTAHPAYVDPVSGNDNNDGSALRPVKTAAKAMLLNPDWLFIKSGTTLDLPRRIYIPRDGFTIATYGGNARAIIRCGVGGAFECKFGNLRIIGLHIKPAPGLLATNDGPVGLGMVSSEETPLENVLVEDCCFDSLLKGIAIDQFTGPGPQNVKIRRCSFIDCYNTQSDHCSGMYAGGINGFTVEECLFDHNGWREDIPGAGLNQWTVFRRGLYIGADCSGVVLKGNIFARSGSEGFQNRPGGDILDNLCLCNGVSGIFAGANGQVLRNVVLDSRNMTPNDERGCGIDCGSMTSGEVAWNICAHRTTAGNYGIWGIALPASAGTSLVNCHDNHVYHWEWGTSGTAYFMGAGATFRNNTSIQAGGQCNALRSGIPSLNNRYWGPDSGAFWAENMSRVVDWTTWKTMTGESGSTFNTGTMPPAVPTIGQYAASLGLPATIDGFLNAARQQSKANWNESLTAAAVGNYMRQTIGMTISGS